MNRIDVGISCAVVVVVDGKAVLGRAVSSQYFWET